MRKTKWFAAILAAVGFALCVAGCQVDTDDEHDENVISAFAAIPKIDPFANGTAQETIKNALPKSLIATVNGKENQTISGVTWELDGEYKQQDEEQTITFTAQIPNGYKLADGTELPKITVTVKAVENVISAFTPLANEVTAQTVPHRDWKSVQKAVNQPTELTATVNGKENQTITGVTWKQDREYNEKECKEQMLVFTAALPDGYKQADGVELPKITVTVSAYPTLGDDNPNKQLTIEKNIVTKCDPNAKAVEIPYGVTSIGGNAFKDCVRLESVVIPGSVTSIGDGAFYGCVILESVEIPDSITSIGKYAFKGCSSLTSITIPGSVTSIKSDAFYGCSSLTSVTIPDSVTSIEGYAFYDCSSLTSVTIPDSVTSIGNGAFGGCSSLESVSIPDRVTSIGYEAFYGCSSLTSVTIPDSVTSIGNGAFGGCSSLESVSIPDRVTSIESNTFNGCNSLSSVTIPDSVTSIGRSAFSGCENIDTIIYGGTLVQWFEAGLASEL